MNAGKNTQWLVPVTVSTASSPAEAVHKFILIAQEETVTVDRIDPDDWLKVIVLTLCWSVVSVVMVVLINRAVNLFDKQDWGMQAEVEIKKCLR